MPDRLNPSIAGINIFSGEKGLGGALTNPTELARKKGSITEAYPVVFAGKRWSDVESAYHILGAKTASPAARDRLMAELIAAKFAQHPALAGAVEARGGAAFILRCTHWTGAKSEGARAWEGAGPDSRFIRNLAAGWALVEGRSGQLSEQNQALLF